ncbi:hypothetical protein Tco_1123667 [Tanacetum coccineum]|uniref:Uncharacterized protein n=1 Tax=Tanacetum coccineum TaxID=301880 RepID=A0ABQ5J423_9ASTR
MIQYLKNMAGYSHAQLKDKSFDKVQKLFEKHMKWINNFVPMEEDLPSGKVQKEESSEKKAEGHSRKKSIGRKRAKDKQEKESSKSEFDREDLVNLGKLVKAKHGDNRPEEDFERVLWGDLRVMFEPDVESKVWRSLQGYKVTIWKLYDSCGVHFVSTADTKVNAAGLQLLEELLLSEG